MNSSRENKKSQFTKQLEEMYKKGYEQCLRDKAKQRNISKSLQISETRELAEQLTEDLWEYKKTLIKQLRSISNSHKNNKLSIKVIDRALNHHFILPFEEHLENKIDDEFTNNIIR